MQLKIEDLNPEDVQRLGLIEKMPINQELGEAELEYWRNPTAETYAKYLNLRKIEYAWTIYRPHYITKQGDIKETKDHLSVTLRNAVWGFDNHDLWIEYPETWWDAFKNRWYPDWLLRMYPTQWIEWNITSKTLYPLLEIESPTYTHTLVYDAFREETSHWDRVETDHYFGMPEGEPYPKSFWKKAWEFIKECIP